MRVLGLQQRALPVLFLATVLAFFHHAARADQVMHPVTDGLAIGEAIHFEGLTLYPVLATRELPSGEYLNMQEGLSRGSLKISENNGGNVPTLVVVNSGSVPVLLVVGDVVKGGRQDRVIAQDVIILPEGEPQVVAVNCVEAGRWANQGGGIGGGGASFSFGGRGEAELKEVLQHERNQGATWKAVAELNEDKRKKLMALSAMADIPEGQLAETVDQVLATRSDGPAAYANLAPSSGTYMASLESPEISTRADAMVEALLPGLEADLQVIGLVAAVGGELITAELYGDAALFEFSKSSILRGLALDALSDEQLIYPEPPSAEQAAKFLATALGGEVIDEVDIGGASKVRRETEGASSFEFEGSDGDFLHINIYAR